ncbi:hypothetical protein ACFL6Z_11885, partial [Pseudomonadota bacterium]
KKTFKCSSNKLLRHFSTFVGSFANQVSKNHLLHHWIPSPFLSTNTLLAITFCLKNYANPQIRSSNGLEYSNPVSYFSSKPIDNPQSIEHFNDMTIIYAKIALTISDT